MKCAIYMMIWYAMVIFGVLCIFSTPADNSEAWLSELIRSQLIGWFMLVGARLMRKTTSIRNIIKEN